MNITKCHAGRETNMRIDIFLKISAEKAVKK
jgi:hypothetical protein